MQKLRIGYKMKTKDSSFLKKLNIISIVLCVIMLSACTSRDKNTSTDRLSVVAVNFAQYDFARAVCGESADVQMIMRPGAEVHGYEPSLSDIIAIENADVLVYGGGANDVWVDKILTSVNTGGITLVPLMEDESINLYKEEVHSSPHSHPEHDHHHHEGTGAYDEHIWTSPKNAMRIVNIIEETVSERDPENRDIYKKNASEYINRLAGIDEELTDAISGAKSKFVAVADRFPFLYLAKDYGLEYAAAFSGCSPESDAGPSVIANMIEEINHHGTKAVFYIELSNQKMADAICENTGAKKLLLHSCQSISREDFEMGVSYADLMEQNITNLKEALGL